MTTEKDVIDGVTAFVNTNYAGNWFDAFVDLDKDDDDRLSTNEVAILLLKAGVGWKATRLVIAEKIIERMDANQDGFVSFDEFEAVLRTP